MIISFYSYSYSLPDGYAIQQQSATAQPQPSIPPPQTGGEGQQQSGTESLTIAAVGDSKAESEAKVTFTNIKNEKPDLELKKKSI